MLYAIGLSLSLYVAVLLLKNIRETPHRVLFTLVLLWAVRFFIYWVKSSEWLVRFPWMVVIDQNLFLLDGPLMWLYVQAVNQRKILHWRNLLHFVPFAFLMWHSFNLLLNVSSDQLLATFQNAGKQLSQGNHSIAAETAIFIGIVILSLMIYGWLSIRDLNRYHHRIKSQLSNIEQVRLQWFRQLLIGWMLFLTLPIFLFFTNYLFGFGNFTFFQSGLNISLIVFVGLVGYFGSNQQYMMLSVEPAQAKISQEAATPKEKYQKSGLTAEEIQEKHQAFVEKITAEKWYLQEDLSLNELAQLLGVKPNTLSQVINVATNDNFYDFVNRFRVEAVKQLLPHSRESVLQVAFECGFKSKSTFNACFKKFTGYTPTQYRNLKKS